MKLFREFVSYKIFSEGVASNQAIWSYIEVIKKDPKLSDISTLLNMARDSWTTEDKEGIWADFLPAFRDLKRQLPQDEQQILDKQLARIKPKDEGLRMFLLGQEGFKFEDFDEFEKYVLKNLNNNPSAVTRVCMKKENKYFWQMLGDDIKKDLLESLKNEERRNKNQPTLSELIKRSMRQKPDGDDENVV